MEVVTIYKTDYKELKGLTLCNVNPFFISIKQIKGGKTKSVNTIFDKMRVD